MPSSAKYNDCSDTEDGVSDREQCPTTRKASKTPIPRACSHCCAGHRRCDKARPCGQCVRLGRQDSCVDAAPFTARKKKEPKEKISLSLQEKTQELHRMIQTLAMRLDMMEDMYRLSGLRAVRTTSMASTSSYTMEPHISSTHVGDRVKRMPSVCRVAVRCPSDSFSGTSTDSQFTPLQGVSSPSVQEMPQLSDDWTRTADSYSSSESNAGDTLLPQHTAVPENMFNTHYCASQSEYLAAMGVEIDFAS